MAAIFFFGLAFGQPLTVLQSACSILSSLDNFQIITPILEDGRDFRRLAQIHNHISEALSRIDVTVPIIEDIADAWYSPLLG